jgi:ubiquinone/menaquinone biosynthesis C-methylase UbiE
MLQFMLRDYSFLTRREFYFLSVTRAEARKDRGLMIYSAVAGGQSALLVATHPSTLARGFGYPVMQERSISKAPNPTIEAVRDFWNNHVHDWKIAKSPPGTKAFFEEIEAYRYEKLDYLAAAIDFDRFAGKTVLDVGCGVGNDLARFAKAGATVTGVDLAENSVKLAQDNFRFRGLEGTFHRMDGEKLALPDDSFDAVFCHTVLHFTPHPAAMIREVHRVLKPGGEAIIMTVNRYSWMNALQRIMKIEIDHLESPVFYTYSIAEFGNLLRVFGNVRIIPHRFPVRTKVHKGVKARIYNTMFVDLFNLLPRSWVRRSGHHLIAYAHK